MNNVLEQIKGALMNDDAVRVGQLLDAHPELKARINEPIAPFDSPVITCARSRAMLDALLAAGADIHARSKWWAGGFGVLDQAPPDVAKHAIERGAVVDVHAAARLGLGGKLRDLVSADPRLVHARGGDGQTPLHFASTVEIAAYLLDQGADIDARDVDHESTPAQYMLGERQDIARYLVQRGCQTDLLMVTALGDANRVLRHLDADPDCVRLRVTHEFFPMVNLKSGGTIYQWTLGWHVWAHDVARKFGHENIFRLLMDRSPADLKLLIACYQDDASLVYSLRTSHPNLVGSHQDSFRHEVALAARNNQLPAVRRLLAAGLPVDGLGQHRATPLHWAAFHGHAEMVAEILRYNPPMDLRDADFDGTPLRWAVHGSEHGWYCQTGSYPTAVELLLKAGAIPPKKLGGTMAVQEVLRQFGVKG